MVVEVEVHVLGSFLAVLGRHEGHSCYAVVLHSGFYIKGLLLADESFGLEDIEFCWVHAGIMAGRLG